MEKQLTHSQLTTPNNFKNPKKTVVLSITLGDNLQQGKFGNLTKLLKIKCRLSDDFNVENKESTPVNVTLYVKKTPTRTAHETQFYHD